MEEIKGEYTVHDYILANRCGIKSSNLQLLALSLCIFFLLLAIYNIFLVPYYMPYWVSFFFFLCCVLYPFLFLPFLAAYFFKIQRQLHGQIIISFDDDSITEKSELTEFKQKWMYKYASCRDIILFFNTPQTFLMVPRRFCQDDEQYKRLITLAEKLSRRR